MLTTGEPVLLNLACAVHRRFQVFPGRWRLGSWIEGRRGNLVQVRSGPKAMGHGIELFISMQDIYDGQKYFVHGFNAREPLGNLLCQVMRRGDSALDIGANVGYFTGMLSLLAGKEGQVFSFEAAPLIHERLQTVALRNPHGNVRTYHCAVSDRCGQVELNLGPPDHTGISSMRDLPGSGGKVSVPAVTIDSLLAELPTIRLAKIDVEGAEMQVLGGMAGLIERDHPYLFIEVTDSFLRNLGSGKQELVAYLVDRGYTPYRIGRRVEPYVHRDEYQCDVVFVPPGEPMVSFDENLQDFAARAVR